MVKMYAPKGITQVTVEQQNFKVDKDNSVTVPDNFVPKLRDIGFKVGPLTATVSTSTAAALKGAAAKATTQPAAPVAPADDSRIAPADDAK